MASVKRFKIALDWNEYGNSNGVEEMKEGEKSNALTVLVL
jgi:hypothetical protein